MREIFLIIILLFSINSFADELRTDIPAYTGEWGFTAIHYYNDETWKYKPFGWRFMSNKDIDIVTNNLYYAIHKGHPIPTDAVEFVSLCLYSTSLNPASRIADYIRYNTISHPRMINLLTDARTNYYRYFLHLKGKKREKARNSWIASIRAQSGLMNIGTPHAISNLYLANKWIVDKYPDDRVLKDILLVTPKPNKYFDFTCDWAFNHPDPYARKATLGALLKCTNDLAPRVVRKLLDKRIKEVENRRKNYDKKHNRTGFGKLFNYKLPEREDNKRYREDRTTKNLERQLKKWDERYGKNKSSNNIIIKHGK